ncbi:MAG: branched-chain amino acid ABC transporter substrate-binding protein, partial [Geminicoccaceae bacterium]
MNMLPVAANAEIAIALVGPLTGPSAAIGEQMQKGAEMAVEHINEAGGILGEPVVLEVGDDTCDPDDAVTVANQLRDSRVVFVAGHFCSGSSIPASKVYAEAGILQISPGSTNPELTDQGLDNVFRVCGRDDLQGPTAADYVIDNQIADKIAVIHDKSAYGQGLADEFRKQVNARGVEEVFYTGIDAGERRFDDLIESMKEAEVDLMYFGGYHLEAGLITRQAREAGLNTRMMSGDTLLTREFWDITADAGEGTLFTFEADPREFDVARGIVGQFRESGYEPEGYTLFTYAAVQVFSQAAEIAGSVELDQVAKTIKSNRFDTMLGRLAFDDKGDVIGTGYHV